MEKVKYISMITAIFTQLTGIIFLFINITIAFGLFFVYFLSLLVLLITFIKSRVNEKKDYRDY
jgi:RsiW-degrading membrane proteinase PrsW (M82 family)